MKKILLIVLVILIAILLLGWGYLLLNGAPENAPGTGTNFNSLDGGENTVLFVEDTDELPVDVSIQNRLSRITDTPVAGAVFIDNNNDDPTIQYAERGTGHLYEVSLLDGFKNRLSNTTIPRVVDAVWSPVGNRVALTTANGPTDTKTFVGTLVRDDTGEQALEILDLRDNAENVVFGDGGDVFYYTTRNEHESVGYFYNLKTGEETEIFTIPFRDVVMLWDTTSTGDHYLYTKPSANYFGYLYRLSVNDSFERIGIGLAGLMAERISNDGFIISSVSDGSLQSFHINANTGSSTSLGLPLFPEKCASSNVGTSTQATALCASPTELPQGKYPDGWYQGTVSFSDLIWNVNLNTGEATSESILEAEANTEIDATDLSVSRDGRYTSFINKNDGALWLLSVEN